LLVLGDAVRRRIGVAQPAVCVLEGNIAVAVDDGGADARYCSKACRERARWQAKRQKNDVASLDTVPPENLADSVQETQQNWGSKSDPQETERFPACIWLEGASGITFVQGSKTGAGFVTLDKNGAHDYGLIPSFSGIMTRAPRVSETHVHARGETNGRQPRQQKAFRGLSTGSSSFSPQCGLLRQ